MQPEKSPRSRLRTWILRIAALGVVVGLVGAGYVWRRGWLERSFWRANIPCGDQDWTPAPPSDDERDLALELEPADATFRAATSISFHPDLDVAYVTEQIGAVTVLRAGVAEAAPALEIPVSVDSDQGLFTGIVSPDGDWLLVSYTDVDDDSALEAFALDDEGTPDPDSGVIVLAEDQPTVLHNGGALAYLPDGTLLLTLGDGGKIGDRDNNAQRPETLLGSLLRIEPTPAADPPYRIPDDNPFADSSSAGQGADPDDAAPETWAIGLRNPYRVSVDAEGGRVWVTDVGHSCYDEVESVPIDHDAVPNFGWNRFEGTRVFLGGEPENYVPPLVALPHANDQTSAVIGGAVARGDAAPSLEGQYLFADLCSAALYAIDADDPTPELIRLDLVPPGVFGIMADPAGDIWVASPGQVARIVER